MKLQDKPKRKSTNYRDDELLKRIGQNLRVARKAKKLTMRQLAHELEVDYSQIQRMETGIANFTVSSLALVAKALDVSLADLFK